MDLITEITILILGAFVGFEVISKIPNTLHTPLMSATNAIHGIVLLGGILLIGEVSGFVNKLILVIAIAFGTINVVGGFLVTDRMLRHVQGAGTAAGGRGEVTRLAAVDFDVIRSLYIVAFSLFIIGLMQVTSPKTARRGNLIAAVGMAVAVIATLLIDTVGDYGLIALGIAIGTAVGIPAARSVKMTAMPQMVALFNGVGGGAVALISWADYRHALATGGQSGARDADPDPVRRDHRLGLLLGLEHRLRQAPGDHPGPADPASRASCSSTSACSPWPSAARWRSPPAPSRRRSSS